jgi:outer membrane protein, multidrug efflux system
MKLSESIYSLILAGTLIAFTGCKSLKPAEQLATIETPKTFATESDSASVGSMKWDRFFTDEKLIALIDTALQNNLDLKMAVQRIEMASSLIMARQGALLPSLGGDVSGGGRKFGDYTMDGVGNYDTNFSDNLNPDRKLPAPLMPDYFLGLRSSWEVDIWGKLKTQRKAAYTRFLSSQKAQQVVVTGLVSQVASLYYELVTLDAELAIIRKNITLQEKAVTTINVQKQAGRANELGVQQFTAQLLNTKSLETEIQQRIYERENELNLLLGRFPQLITRSDSLYEVLPKQVSAGVPGQMLRRRPDIQQAELELMANYSDQQAARLAFLPSLNITAFLGFNTFKSSLLFNPGSLAYSAIGGLTAPLLNRKPLKAEQKRSEAAALESLFAYNKSVLNGFQEVSTSLRKIENTKRIADFKNQEVAVLQQAVATSQDLFVGGYATYLEIITAQKSVLEAELTLINVRKEQRLAMIQLYRALGGGWE